MHFSAFFGEWGDRRASRPQFQGHFHRLRMFWPLSEHAFLFLCDTFGADRNGSYYKGEDNDFFVERAMEQIMASVRAGLGVAPARAVAMGSSMGATAALRFALRDGLAGAVAVSPHIDLDLSARYQGRARHVAAIVGRQDVESTDLYPVTREIRALVETVDPVPRIVMQSMRDDDGVHEEQVLPFVSAYRARGGWVELDERATGGTPATMPPRTGSAGRSRACWRLSPSRRRRARAGSDRRRTGPRLLPTEGSKSSDTLEERFRVAAVLVEAALARAPVEQLEGDDVPRAAGHVLRERLHRIVGHVIEHRHREGGVPGVRVLPPVVGVLVDELDLGMAGAAVLKGALVDVDAPDAHVGVLRLHHGQVAPRVGADLQERLQPELGHEHVRNEPAALQRHRVVVVGLVIRPQRGPVTGGARCLVTSAEAVGNAMGLLEKRVKEGQGRSPRQR